MATSIKNISILIFLFNIVFPQCDECENVWMDSYWGEQCCDVAWDQWGFDCSYMESEYGWDCAGCACPYDNNATNPSVDWKIASLYENHGGTLKSGFGAITQQTITK